MSEAAAPDSRSRQARDRIGTERFVVLRAPFPEAVEALRTAIAALDAQAGNILQHCDYQTQIVAEFARPTHAS